MRRSIVSKALTVFALAALATNSGTATSAEHSVKYFQSTDVRAAFEQGMPLLEQFNYKIHASRRVAPGQVEVHETDTDIIHVLEGTAMFVTGGKVIDARTTAPHEVRGADIDGGTTYRLAAGDVMVVPAGTPHWFKDVRGPFLYYVVKVE